MNAYHYHYPGPRLYTGDMNAGLAQGVRTYKDRVSAFFHVVFFTTRKMLLVRPFLLIASPLVAACHALKDQIYARFHFVLRTDA